MQHNLAGKENYLPKLIGRCIRTAGIMLLVLVLCGCGGLRGRTQVQWKYTLEYASPLVQGLATTPHVLQVKLFTVVQNYNSIAMVYQPAPFKLQQYQRSSWRVNPGDMVTDYLLRDLRKQNLFKAVFSYREPGTARFALEGEIEQFAEVDEPEGSKALLSVYVTLLDTAQKDVTKMILCQKNYCFSAPFTGKGPAALAQGMSMAMEKFSRQLMLDLSRRIPPQ